MKYEPYHALINAIILQAVKDYRTALDDENTSGIAECERFFRSDWFTFLADVFRYNLFLDNLLQEAMLSEDHQSLVFDSKKIEEAVKFCYFERYKKKLATLRTQATKYEDKK